LYACCYLWFFSFLILSFLCSCCDCCSFFTLCSFKDLVCLILILSLPYFLFPFIASSSTININKNPNNVHSLLSVNMTNIRSLIPIKLDETNYFLRKYYLNMSWIVIRWWIMLMTSVWCQIMSPLIFKNGLSVIRPWLHG
jgi:hypothetical protein